MKVLRLFSILCAAAALFPFSADALPSSDLHLDSWAYPALEKLSGLGLIDTALQGTRPYVRREAARQTAEARRSCEEGGCPAVARELIACLERELEAELASDYPGPPAPFRLQDRDRQAVGTDGTAYLPYLLTNTGRKAASYTLDASTRQGERVPLFADLDADGRPDGEEPLPRAVAVEPGEAFPFVAAVPPAGAAGSDRSVHVSATAARPAVETERFVPLRELRVGYVYRDGEESTFPGSDAEQFALNTLNQGIGYRDHHNLQAILQSELRLGDFLLLDWRPLVSAKEGKGASLRTLQGTAALGLGPFRLSAGRQSLWWGQGRRGSLLLSDNAQPLDMVRLTNPLPARLPWIFGVLGPFRFDLFVSRLEKERAVPEPWFGGLRVNFRPASWLEVGASRTVIFGGDGRPDVDFDDFLTIVGGENVGGAAESNQIAAIDARIRIPALRGLELYGEYGGEDEADLFGFIPFIAKKAFLLGLYLPRLEPSGRLGLRLEHADLSTRGEDFSVWYRHHIYRSGYVYEGDLLGHPVGGDGRETWGELRWYASPEITLAAGLALQRRGETRPVQEEHTIPSLEATWWASDTLSLTARYAYDRAENIGFVPGEDDEYHFGGVEMRAGW